MDPVSRGSAFVRDRKPSRWMGAYLRRGPGMIDHRSGIGCEATHGAAEMGIDFHDLLDTGGFEEGRLDTLFYAEDDAFGCLYPDSGRTELHDGRCGVAASVCK
jgi:hypothetical protein